MQTSFATRTDGLPNSLDHRAYLLASRRKADHGETINFIGTDVPFARNAQVYCEGDPSTYLYRLTNGLVRCYRMASDGCRQIVAFYVPGDLFGFEVGQRHTLSAEAITQSRVHVIKRSSMITATSRDDLMARELWLNINREIRRGQEHILQFGRSADARVASFLLEMLKRVPTANGKLSAVSRQDIADYLELRIETVSRAMTRLAKAGAVAPSGRRKITICDREALHHVANEQAQIR